MRNILRGVLGSVWMCLALPAMCADWNGERAQAFAPILTNPSFQQLLLSHARSLTRDFSYAELLGDETDVLLVGEEHHDPIPAREVNLMIKELSQESGLSHVASEFLLAQEQPFLDKFAAGEIDYEELRSQCTLANRTFVAKIAKRYGVRVIGLDVARDREQYYDWAMSEAGMQARNRSWRNILVNLKRAQPQAKIVLHAGSLHTQLFSKYVSTMPQLLQQAGFKTKTVEFVSQHDPEWRQLNLNIQYDTLFEIPQELKDFIRADYVVYMSEREFSRQDQEEMEQAIKQMGGVDDGCVLDPDNAVCRVHIRSGRK